MRGSTALSIALGFVSVALGIAAIPNSKQVVPIGQSTQSGQSATAALPNSSATAMTAEGLNRAGNEALARADYVSAAHWYLPAAEEGLADAQTNLALLYLDGRGVRRDERAAVKWLTAAASRGFSAAQFRLGAVYAAGMGGLPQDIHMARGYYELAAAQGNEDAEAAIRDLNRRGDRWVDPPHRDGEVRAIAKGISILPGTLICPDSRTADAMFYSYTNYLMDVYREKLTHGQSALIDGAAVKPDLAAWGCTLIPAGVALSINLRNIVPIATAARGDGTTVTGVTLASGYVKN